MGDYVNVQHIQHKYWLSGKLIEIKKIIYSNFNYNSIESDGLVYVVRLLG